MQSQPAPARVARRRVKADSEPGRDKDVAELIAVASQRPEVGKWDRWEGRIFRE